MPKEWLSALSARRCMAGRLQVTPVSNIQRAFAISERWKSGTHQNGKMVRRFWHMYAENIRTGRTCSAWSYFSDCRPSKYMCASALLCRCRNISKNWFQRFRILCAERCLLAGISFLVSNLDWLSNIWKYQFRFCVTIYPMAIVLIVLHFCIIRDCKMEICLSGYDLMTGLMQVFYILERLG